MIDVIPLSACHTEQYGTISVTSLLSFNNYFDPRNAAFGSLLVFNDYRVPPAAGFKMHPIALRAAFFVVGREVRRYPEQFACAKPVTVQRVRPDRLCPSMAANEVLANRANEILTGYKGSDQVHPNTHVNMASHSTMWCRPPRIAIHNEVGRVLKAAARMRRLWTPRPKFVDVVKMGRTCLQDAVPITLGQEFSGYAAGIRRNRLLLERERARWCTGVLGATAVCTGMGCMPGFSEHIYKNLSAVCGREIRRDANLFDGLQASDSFIILHAHLQALATVAAKAALDIRLMGSGPRAGFGDIVIPAVQPGSSIMPGKISGHDGSDDSGCRVAAIRRAWASEPSPGNWTSAPPPPCRSAASSTVSTS
ncbi:MAG: lyase family protein [Bilophila wadsworthia]